MKWIGFRPLTSTYTHAQNVAASTWAITHNLDKHPSVTVVDSAETVVTGTIVYNSKNQLTITFEAGGDAVAFSGKAYLY